VTNAPSYHLCGEKIGGNRGEKKIPIILSRREKGKEKGDFTGKEIITLIKKKSNRGKDGDGYRNWRPGRGKRRRPALTISPNEKEKEKESKKRGDGFSSLAHKGRKKGGKGRWNFRITFKKKKLPEEKRRAKEGARIFFSISC